MLNIDIFELLPQVALTPNVCYVQSAWRLKAILCIDMPEFFRVLASESLC